MRTKSKAPSSCEWRDLAEFKSTLREFVAERDWDQFHSPKNLAMALAGEVDELFEHFQWLSAEQSAGLTPDDLEKVAMEIADVQIYLAALADRLGVEIGPAVERKMRLNAAKHPADLARGSAAKYTAYEKPGLSAGTKGEKKT